jgi:hypothetical protein
MARGGRGLREEAQVLQQRPLHGVRIAISISDSPDLPYLGLDQRHLRDAMAEIARQLLSAGAHLVYGGDLRIHGFSDLLFEIAETYRSAGDPERMVTNYLPWPVHMSWSADELREMEERTGPAARLVYLDRDGKEIGRDDRMAAGSLGTPAEDDWVLGLTAMRQVVTDLCDARLVLGGATSGSRGVAPGIAEEALRSLEAGKPVYVAGGFGGCAREIASQMELAPPLPEPLRSRELSLGFHRFRAADLGTGLDEKDVLQLASTPHADEIATLVLRGMFRRLGVNTQSTKWEEVAAAF